ncbi:hypothetical protein [Natrononativus amylolyticus]|uniref:hypothetical protein n=1 Tax=Natrononativus amylolyticus TaxID=2963434 RepID=UPI0020CBEC48|nr:hypothetical protein [Natrononativus amylolyticus]
MFKSSVSRRAFLTATGSTALLSAAQTVSASSGVSRYDYPLMAGTQFETDVYVIDSGKAGPTGFIVGGQHGIEPEGWRAAHRLRELVPREGKVVILPEADRTAIADTTYSGRGGNLNRHWPSGSRPSSRLARAIWNELESYDPDVVLDLHSSMGIYGGSPSGVGQAIFPTPNARSGADDVIRELNDRHVRPAGYGGDALFTRGNDQTGANPLLSHKVGGDTNAVGFLFETSRSVGTPHLRTEWTYWACRKLVRRGGLVLQG